MKTNLTTATRMKRNLKFAALAFIGSIFMSLNVSAQNDETQIIQGMYGMQKRDIVSKSITLTAEEAPKFWAVYDGYETERKKLGSERLQIIADYASTYQTLTAEQADNLSNRVFASDMAYDKLHKTYYAKLKKEVGALKAASFFQLEGYLQSAVRFTIQDNIPFIAELERIKRG